MKFEHLINKAVESELFTAPILGHDMKRFLDENGEAMIKLAQQAREKNIQHIYWVGSGNSWVNLYSGKYLLDKFSDIPNDCLTSYEFVWRNPLRLQKNAWVFLASYSGATEDTVAALHHAKQHGAFTIAIVNKADSLMGKEADEVIAYNSKALYILPMTAAYLFSLEMSVREDTNNVQEIIDGIFALPSFLEQQYIDEKFSTYDKAIDFQNENLIYTLGSGPLYGLAYKFGLTVFMENMRINGSFIDATEFRHGPVEMFYREKPAMVFLLGTDSSRNVVKRVIDVCKSNNAHILIFDMAHYPEIHPLLAPFALMIPLQWFAVWSSFMRGIEDLDERVVMGHGILSKGEGVTWP